MGAMRERRRASFGLRLSLRPPVLRPLSVLLVALFAAGAAAQTGTVRGFVVDATDGQPLIGVNVFATPIGGEGRGASTDIDGLYTIADLPVGTYGIRVTYVGYTTLQDTVQVESGILSLSYEIRPASVELGGIDVSAERPGGAADVTAGLQKIQPRDIELMPSPDVSGDLANYLTTLPSVVTTGDQGGQLFIRGGEPSQNQVRLDGIPIYQPFHLIGFYSAFPSDIVSGVDFSAGGYGARYGGFLSSVLDVSARTGNKRAFEANGAASPFLVSFGAEGPIAGDDVSMLVSARRAVVDPVGSQIVGRDLPFEFSDVFGKVHARLSPESQVSLTGIRTSDDGIVGDLASPGVARLQWTNTGAGVRLLYLPSDFDLTADVVLSYSLHDMQQGDDVLGRSSTIQRTGAEFSLTHTTRLAVINFGGSLEAFSLDAALEGLFSDFRTDKQTVTEVAGFVEPEITLGALELRPGLRITTAPSERAVFIEPRGRAVLNLGAHRLSAAAGRYHQSLVGLTDRRDATSLFTAWTSAPDGRTPTGSHVIGGYKVRPFPGLDVAVEGFYKTFENLSVGEFSSTPAFTTALRRADGAAAGGDARVEVNGSYGSLSLTYALTSVRYRTSSPAYVVFYGAEELAYRPGHDRRHQVSVFGATELAGFNLSARWQFGSGLPFSQALGFDRFLYIGDGPVDPLTDSGEPRVLYDEPFAARLPTYHRFDVSVDREFTVGPTEVTAQVGLINAYDRRNLLAFDVFTLKRTDQLPLFPVFGLRVDV